MRRLLNDSWQCIPSRRDTWTSTASNRRSRRNTADRTCNRLRARCSLFQHRANKWPVQLNVNAILLNGIWIKSVLLNGNYVARCCLADTSNPRDTRRGIESCSHSERSMSIQWHTRSARCSLCRHSFHSMPPDNWHSLNSIVLNRISPKFASKQSFYQLYF